MSAPLKLSLSDELLRQIDAARGLHSRQEFIANATIAALSGRDLAAELDALRARVDALAQPAEPQPEPALFF